MSVSRLFLAYLLRADVTRVDPLMQHISSDRDVAVAARSDTAVSSIHTVHDDDEDVAAAGYC